jgi:alpha-glucuronidase
MTRRHWRVPIALVIGFALLAVATPAAAETGYDLWLRYVRVDDDAQRRAYRTTIASVIVQGDSPTERVIAEELQRALTGLLGESVPAVDIVNADGALVVGTPRTSPIVASLGWQARLDTLGNEG